MPYRVRISKSVQRKIISWALPDPVLVEVYLQLGQVLPDRPLQRMQRTRQPFDGMQFSFSMIDPENRLCEHWFLFQVLYISDEETLEVVNGGYRRQVGW